MPRITRILLGTGLAVLLMTGYALVTTTHTQHTQATAQAKENKAFQTFVARIRQEARARGVSEKTIQKYLTGLKAPIVKLIHALKHEPQDVLTYKAYAKSFVSTKKVNTGRKLFKQHHALLKRVEKHYRVPASVIVAIWGDESDYGRMKGTHPLVASLVTLSFQHHRSRFFRQELFKALKMLNHQKIPQQAWGYFDGGMGQPSFMPSAYFAYAVDFDKDGFANIWTSLPDVFASIANYLHKAHWSYGQPWVVAARIPANFPKHLLGKKHQLTVREWEKHGVTLLERPPELKHAPNSKASLLVPDKGSQNAYLVFHNFKVLMRWNNDTFEAISIGLLANKIRHM